MIPMLKHFIALVDSGSFTKASEQVFISQPALSKSIKKLEENFGCALIHKTAKGYVPTNYGKIIYHHARILEHNLNDMYIDLAQTQSRSEHHLSIAYGLLWELLYIAQLMITAEKEKEGSLSVSGSHDFVSRAIREVLEGRYDIYLGQIPPLENDRLVYEPLLMTTPTIFAREDHPLFREDRSKSITLSDLCAYTWIMFGDSGAFGSFDLPGLFKKNVRLKILYDINSIHIIIDILRQTNSLILLPCQTATPLRRYKIKAFTEHSIHFKSFHSGAIYRKSMEKNESLLYLIDTIKRLIHQKNI